MDASSIRSLTPFLPSAELTSEQERAKNNLKRLGVTLRAKAAEANAVAETERFFGVREIVLPLV